VAVLYRSARSVTRPIQLLREASSRVLAGTFRVVPPEGPREIADLIMHFNHMGLTLTERTTLLQEQEERDRPYIEASPQTPWHAGRRGSRRHSDVAGLYGPERRGGARRRVARRHSPGGPTGRPRGVGEGGSGAQPLRARLPLAEQSRRVSPRHLPGRAGHERR